MAKPYARSERREETKRKNRETLLAAAWQIFSTVGFDGSSARDIIEGSGLSPGTFYNYFGTKEAIFDQVHEGLLEKVRLVTLDARNRGKDLQEKLLISYEAMLRLLLTIDDGFKFFEINQHHIRPALQNSPLARAIIADLMKDLRAELDASLVTEDEMMLMASLIFTNGLEALSLASRSTNQDPKSIAAFTTRVLMFGIGSWWPQAQRARLTPVVSTPGLPQRARAAFCESGSYE